MTNGTLQATERVVLQKVEPSEGFWQFIIPSENADLKLSTQLNTPNTQEGHAQYVSEKGLYAGTCKDVFRIGSALYALRGKGGQAEQARRFMQNAFRTQFPSTQTRIAYTPLGEKDIIIDNIGKASRQETLVDFTGIDVPLRQMPLELCLALTGKTPEEASEIMSYLNDRTPSYLLRVNQKPKQRTERVVRFGAGSDWAGLGCWYPAVCYPALRVRRKKF